MTIAENQKEQVINFGAFGYGVKKISSILEVDEKEIEKDFKDPKSQLYKLLEKGRDMAEYVIDLKLFEMAKSGDIKAMDKIEARRRINSRS